MATTRKRAQKQQQKEMSTVSNNTKKPDDEASNIPRKRRAAFGDITNAVHKIKKDNQGKKATKKAQKKKSYLVAVSDVKRPEEKATTTETSSSQPTDVSYEVIQLSQGSTNNSSQESGSSQESKSSNSSGCSEVELLNEKNNKLSQERCPSQADDLLIVDVDQENLNDPFQVGLYAFDIFNYYREREAQFVVQDYMSSQPDLTVSMRAILVDWLVEVQENFELNHETLYLAVKIVDLYLGLKTVAREKLQLIGATALFISSKFDERSPPVLDDFLYICDDAYTRPEMLSSEMEVLKTIGFDLGIPLSYRFLRRYAKCSYASMDVLTLARYILEMALMDYKYSQVADSKVAAAALLVAISMKKTFPWDDQLVYYTGYRIEELVVLASQLNTTIAGPVNKNLNTIRAKYSHKVFLEVASIPALTKTQVEELLQSLPHETAVRVLEELSQLEKPKRTSPDR